ncbi:hypothetical protein CCH79_00017180, partial [Gambusia affinis]
MAATSFCLASSRGMPISKAAAARRRTLEAECTTRGMTSFAQRTAPSHIGVGTCSNSLETRRAERLRRRGSREPTVSELRRSLQNRGLALSCDDTTTENLNQSNTAGDSLGDGQVGVRLLRLSGRNILQSLQQREEAGGVGRPCSSHHYSSPPLGASDKKKKKDRLKTSEGRLNRTKEQTAAAPHLSEPCVQLCPPPVSTATDRTHKHHGYTSQTRVDTSYRQDTDGIRTHHESLETLFFSVTHHRVPRSNPGRLNPSMQPLTWFTVLLIPREICWRQSITRYVRVCIKGSGCGAAGDRTSENICTEQLHTVSLRMHVWALLWTLVLLLNEAQSWSFRNGIFHNSIWLEQAAGVYHRESRKGRYQLTYKEAKAVCKYEGGTLATYDQLEAARQIGFHVCAAGWFDRGRVGYPIVKAGANCGFGRVGIVDYGYRLNKTKECGGVLTEQQKIIQSPGFPDEYQDELICYWHIRVRLGQRIRLHFLELDVEEDTSCLADYLEVYDSYDDVSGFAG